MIYPRYTAFRWGFDIAAGADLANDGLPRYPEEMRRINGFDGTIDFPLPLAFPVTITCNGGLSDTADSDSYGWYLSQRSDELSEQALLLSHSSLASSGTVTLNVTSNVTRLVTSGDSADYVVEEGVRRIFKHARLYVQRASDTAIQSLDLTTTILGLGL